MPGAALEPLPQYRFEDVVEADDAADAAAFLRETTRLEEVSGLLAAEYGIPVASRVLRGSPAEVLAEHVRASGAERSPPARRCATRWRTPPSGSAWCSGWWRSTGTWGRG
ncbi:MAG: hypothetical protein ACR2H9_07815 [Longimicrobiaceae bacterium]